jgi:hypothetical protein
MCRNRVSMLGDLFTSSYICSANTSELTDCSHSSTPIDSQVTLSNQSVVAYLQIDRLQHINNNESTRPSKRSFEGSSHGGTREIPHVQYGDDDTRVVRKAVSRTPEQRQGRPAQDVRQPNSSWSCWLLGRLDTTRLLLDGMERFGWVGSCKHVSESDSCNW